MPGDSEKNKYYLWMNATNHGVLLTDQLRI